MSSRAATRALHAAAGFPDFIDLQAGKALKRLPPTRSIGKLFAQLSLGRAQPLARAETMKRHGASHRAASSDGWLIQSLQAGLAPLVLHFTNLPFASLQRTGFAGAGFVHFTNLPFESRQGAAARDGAEAPSSPNAVTAMIKVRIDDPSVPSSAISQRRRDASMHRHDGLRG